MVIGCHLIPVVGKIDDSLLPSDIMFRAKPFSCSMAFAPRTSMFKDANDPIKWSDACATVLLVEYNKSPFALKCRPITPFITGTP